MSNRSRPIRSSVFPSSISRADGRRERIFPTAGPISASRRKKTRTVAVRGGRGTRRRAASVTIPSVPSLPTNSLWRSNRPPAIPSARSKRLYPAEFFETPIRRERIKGALSRTVSNAVLTSDLSARRRRNSGSSRAKDRASIVVPSGRTTRREETLSFTAPYLTVRGPAELLAIIPPIRQTSPLEGSGANMSPSGSRSRSSSAQTRPGSARASRRSLSTERSRPIRERSRTTPGPRAFPVRFVPAVLAVRGTPRSRQKARARTTSVSFSATRTASGSTR